MDGAYACVCFPGLVAGRLEFRTKWEWEWEGLVTEKEREGRRRETRVSFQLLVSSRSGGLDIYKYLRLYTCSAG